MFQSLTKYTLTWQYNNAKKPLCLLPTAMEANISLVFVFRLIVGIMEKVESDFFNRTPPVIASEKTTVLTIILGYDHAR